MSDMYAIKASTLSALGDAMRSKVVPEYRDEEHDFDRLKTKYATSYDDATPVSFDRYETEYIRLSYPEATGLRIEYTIKRLIDESVYDNYVGGTLSFGTSNGDGGLKSQDIRGPQTEGDFILKSPHINSLVITVASYDNPGIRYGVTFKVYLLDANGNEMKLIKPTKLNTLTPLEMVDKLNKVNVFSELEMSDNCQYACSSSLITELIKKYPNAFVTKDITNMNNMFSNSPLEEIPFELNLKDKTNVEMNGVFSYSKLKNIPNITYKGTSYADMASMFIEARELETPPYIYNAYPSNMVSFFEYCVRLRYIPEDYFDTWNFDRVNSYSYAKQNRMFYYCYSLRKIPSGLFDKIHLNTSSSKSYSACFYYYGFNSCYSLDEIVGLPIYTTSFTSNAFYSSFDYCSRLKRLVFKKTDNILNWKNQSIILTSDVGYVTTYYKNNILGYNSGITADKEVVDDATYQALKDDPDWFSMNVKYSRYNHDSAVETINSLPNVTGGSGNTIKFTGASGELTDGGAINTMTDAEIAVAAAKGWTVSFA